MSKIFARAVRRQKLAQFVSTYSPENVSTHPADTWRKYLIANGGTGKTLRDLENSAAAATAGHVINSGVLLDDFETFASYTGGAGGGASGSIAADSTNFKTGTKGLQINPTNGGYSATKTISLNATNAGTFGLWAYIPDLTNVTVVTIYMSSSTTLTSFFSYVFPVSMLKKGWNFLSVGRTSWSNTGSESWSNTMVRMRVRLDCSLSTSSTMTVDSFYYSLYARPKVVMIMDDCFTTGYTEGYTYMNNLGLKGSFGLCSNLIGTAGYMTLAQAQDAFNNGWDMINHTANHNNVSAMTSQQVADEVSPCTSYLSSNNFVRNNSDKLFLYPQGGYSDTAIARLQSDGFLAARSVINHRQATVKGVDNLMLIPSAELRSDSMTLATIKGYVDDAIESGRTLFIFGHKFSASPVAFTEWVTSDYRSLVDYINTKRYANLLDVVTFTEWYASLSQPRKLYY